jgi:dihydrofolate reductase
MSVEGRQPNGGRPLHFAAGIEIEGLAIVSADGMIADAQGVQPPGLLLDADQRFFRERLRSAALLVHGRYSNEGGAETTRHPRLVLTRRIGGIARDPDDATAVLWNPAAATFAEACALAGVRSGRAAVIGGTDVFGLFLGGYGTFHLSRTAAIRLPGGRPVFPGVPELSPEAILKTHRLKPDSTRVLDPSAELTLTTWRR